MIKITGFLSLFWCPLWNSTTWIASYYRVLYVYVSCRYVSLASDPDPNHSSNAALEHPKVKQSIWLTMKALILQDVLFQWSFRPIANLLITVNQSLLGPCWPKHLRRQKTPCSSWHLQVIKHGDSGVWKNCLRTNAKKRGAIFWSLSALES